MDEGREAAPLVEAQRGVVAVHGADQEVGDAVGEQAPLEFVHQGGAKAAVAFIGQHCQRVDLGQALAGSVGLVGLVDADHGVADQALVAPGHEDERARRGEPLEVLGLAARPRVLVVAHRHDLPDLAMTVHQTAPEGLERSEVGVAEGVAGVAGASGSMTSPARRKKKKKKKKKKKN